MDSRLNRVCSELEGGHTVCLVTVVASDFAEVRCGAKMVVGRAGRLEGGSEVPELDRRILEEAGRVLRREGRGGLFEPAPGIRVFVERLEPEPHLLICGAGHVAVPLAELTRRLFRVLVLDDRPEFADPGRFPGCDVRCGDFGQVLSGLSLGPQWSVVVITRGHQHDVDCLREVLGRPTGYVGLMGSRRRVGAVKEFLRASGVPEERLSDLFCPIGLPLGGESPEELALSIASEVVCVRQRGPAHARSLRGEERS